MIKLCVFDFDSTLMDGETVSFIAKGVGKEEEVSKITARAMSGELDFFESFKLRVELLKGLKESKAIELVKDLPFIEGAGSIISYLKSKGVKVVVFSGGFHIATDIAEEKFGFDMNFANYLHAKNGILTGLAGGEMMFSDSKGKMLKRLKKFLVLNDDEVACVGDGANDISMFKESGTSIAFCAHEILKQHATHCVDIRNLNELKQIL